MERVNFEFEKFIRNSFEIFRFKFGKMGGAFAAGGAAGAAGKFCD